MDLQQTISQQIQGEVLDKISQATGTDAKSAESIAQQAIPVLLGGLQKNSKSTKGARDLNDAISKDHDGSTLSDLLGSIGSDGSLQDGGKILGHVFGGNLGKVEDAIGKSTGTNSTAANTALSILAPIVLENLGQAKAKTGTDVATILSGQKIDTKSGVMSIITDLIDQNNDGNVLDDIMQMGSKLFGQKK